MAGGIKDHRGESTAILLNGHIVFSLFMFTPRDMCSQPWWGDSLCSGQQCRDSELLKVLRTAQKRGSGGALWRAVFWTGYGSCTHELTIVIWTRPAQDQARQHFGMRNEGSQGPPQLGSCRQLTDAGRRVLLVWQCGCCLRTVAPCSSGWSHTNQH